MSEPHRPIIPYVHLNGSGMENLIKWRQETLEGLRSTLHGLGNMQPHGRDYYIDPHRGELFTLARKQHEERVECITKMMMDIEAEMQAIYERKDPWGDRQ